MSGGGNMFVIRSEVDCYMFINSETQKEIVFESIGQAEEVMKVLQEEAPEMLWYIAPKQELLC